MSLANTNQHKLAQYTNSMQNNLQFNPTQESNGHINFLDLTSRRTTSHLEIDIYRKPTTKDTNIHFTSTHPNEQKYGIANFGDLDKDGEISNCSMRIWTYALKFLLSSDQKITCFCSITSSPTAHNVQSTKFFVLKLFATFLLFASVQIDPTSVT